jgi:hypothetical protein
VAIDQAPINGSLRGSASTRGSVSSAIRSICIYRYWSSHPSFCRACTFETFVNPQNMLFHWSLSPCITLCPIAGKQSSRPLDAARGPIEVLTTAGRPSRRIKRYLPRPPPWRQLLRRPLGPALGQPENRQPSQEVGTEQSTAIHCQLT